MSTHPGIQENCQIKADLKTVQYHMTNDMLARALFYGLPSNFRDFKEKYD